jgi:hypothetical protein
MTMLAVGCGSADLLILVVQATVSSFREQEETPAT